MNGRQKPYSERGVKRLACVRCGKAASTQWQVCADENLWRPVCWDCDVALNEVVLEFMRFSDVKEKVAAYRLRRKA